MAKEKTKQYKFREGSGKHEYAERNDKGEITERRFLEPGEKVALTRAEYDAFRDKFDPASGKDDETDPVLTATQPQADGEDTSSPSAPGADQAAKDNKADGTAKKTGEKGAGASENSSNSATVPGGAAGSAPTSQNTTGQTVQKTGGNS